MNNVMMPTKKHASTADWLAYFEKNRLHRRPIPWERGVQIETNLRTPVIRSLQRFQVGEQGDGKHLREAAAAIKNPHYSATINLFVQEEQEHSSMLAGLIRALDGNLLNFHWSDICFVLVRRLSGLRVELFTLLAAEIIAQVYYRILYDGFADLVFRDVCTQILHDEDAHVAFHCDYLYTEIKAFSPSIRWLVSTLWRTFFSLVCLVVACDHFSLLHALYISPITFWKDCHYMFARAHFRIFSSQETHF
jgi:hypothetical protein